MSGGKAAAHTRDSSLATHRGLTTLPTAGMPGPTLPAAPTSGLMRRYLSCLRYREVLLLQGSPLLGAAHAIGPPGAGKLAALAVFLVASLMLVAYIFAFNDWSGIDTDLRDAHRAAAVFAAKGISRDAIRLTWISLAAISLTLFAVLGARPLAIAIAIAGLGYVYSQPGAAAKGMPILGSLLHLTGGTLHFLLGVAPFRALRASDLVLALFFGLTFAAGHLNQEVRDFDGDAANGIRTNAVVFGKTAAFAAGLAGFTLAYALLAALAVAGVLPAWLAAVALPLYTLHLYSSLRALAAGLTFDVICRLQARYRLLYAVIGLAMALALVAPDVLPGGRAAALRQPPPAPAIHPGAPR